MKPSSGQLIAEAVIAERKAIIEMLNNRICFNHAELGHCDHSACYELQGIVKNIVLRSFE
jgi:hypothetical protein